ncbi:MAG: N-acetyltransferase [Dehalococcoidia bacterium]|nr:N-acetyltransferase [Dehalococcoidia bacterium]
MSYQVRSESPDDYDAIDLVECQAFGGIDEADLVRLMRARHPGYDAKFSVVAVDDCQIVGHVLFTPADVRLMGKTVRALCVGPVAVSPSRQKQGFGRAMLEFGHDMGRQAGFSFVYLLGNPDYYSRIGYTACYGFAEIEINAGALGEPEVEILPSPVAETDLQWLTERHAAELANVDFGWLRGPDINEWTLPGLNSVVWWTADGRRAGYSVHRSGYSANRAGVGEVNLILADEPELALDIIRTIKPSKIAQHPSGWLARNVVDPAWGTCSVRRSRAAMAIALQPGALDEYIAAVESGARSSGHGNFPPAFELLG